VRETGAKVDASVAKMVARICRAALLVIDDIGILPAGQESAEAFYRVVDAAYEKTSVILTSNIHPSGFDQIMPKGLASAAVDRFMHHAHVVTTEGSSLRLSEALAGRGGGAPGMTTRRTTVRRHGELLSAHKEFSLSLDIQDIIGLNITLNVGSYKKRGYRWVGG